MALDIRSLRFFVQIAELGSLGLAARSLNIAQPALSQRLANLETHLGTQLLLRSTKGVELTADGRRLLDEAREILARVRTIEEGIGRAGEGLHGHIALGLPALAANFLVEPLFRAIRAAEPQLRLRIMEARSGNLLDELLGGQLDLAIVASPPQHQRLESEPLVEESLCLVGPPGSLPETIGFAGLFGKPLALSSAFNDHRNLLSAEAATLGGSLDVVLESTSLATTKRLAAAGDVFGLMVWSAAAGEVAAGELAAARIIDPPLHRTLHLCRLVDRRHSRAADYAAGEIRRQVAALAAAGVLR